MEKNDFFYIKRIVFINEIYKTKFFGMSYNMWQTHILFFLKPFSVLTNSPRMMSYVYNMTYNAIYVNSLYFFLCNPIFNLTLLQIIIIGISNILVFQSKCIRFKSVNSLAPKLLVRGTKFDLNTDHYWLQFVVDRISKQRKAFIPKLTRPLNENCSGRHSLSENFIMYNLCLICYNSILNIFL